MHELRTDISDCTCTDKIILRVLPRGYAQRASLTYDSHSVKSTRGSLNEVSGGVFSSILNQSCLQ